MTVKEEICGLYNIPISLLMSESINQQCEEYKKQIGNGLIISLEIPSKDLD